MSDSNQLLILCGSIVVAGLVGYMLCYWFNKTSSLPQNVQQAAGQTSRIQFNFLPGYTPTDRERQAVERVSTYIEDTYSNVSSQLADQRVISYLMMQLVAGELPFEHMTVSIRMADIIAGITRLS